jgi:glutaredoxin-like protein NrdH
MSIIEKLEYTEEKGKDIGKNIYVYALSTCIHCRHALQFLRDNHIHFKFVYMDKLDFDIKQQVKQVLEQRYSERVVFPYLVIDEKKVLVGFDEVEWKGCLGV